MEGRLSSFTHSYEPVRVTDEDKERFFAGLTYSSSSGALVRNGYFWITEWDEDEQARVVKYRMDSVK